MDLSTFIVAVFCLIDDRIADLGRLRARGPTPTLCDSEVLTIEVVGEFLGLDEDSALFKYFRRHYAHFFPNLSRVHRTTFTSTSLRCEIGRSCRIFVRQNPRDRRLP